LHANLDPKNKKKEEQKVDKDKDNDNGNNEDEHEHEHEEKAETERNEDKETSKSTTTEKKTLIATSEGNFQKPVTNDDDKDSIESPTTVAIVNMSSEKQGCCRGAEDCFERPSKIRKVSNSNGDLLCRRRSRWVELLKERPSDDLEAIHSWTGIVLSVSNPEVDASIWGSSSVSEEPKQQQHYCHLDNNPSEGLSGHWNSLLNQRPKGESSSSNVTKWLIQALEVSDKYKNIKN